MSDKAIAGGHLHGWMKTTRSDPWWVRPTAIGFCFLIFGAYSTWAAFQGNHYWYGSYLSPFYSPVLFVDISAFGSAPLEHSWLGLWPGWWPSLLPASPALLILAFPLSFRATCYYYRKAYYQAMAHTPPACTVGPFPKKPYRGETKLLLLQNFHRYTLYFALIFIGILWYDAFVSFFRDGEFGVGVGSIILTLNATFLGLYTTSCHSFRHIVGGRKNSFNCDGCTTASYGAWKKVSFLNSNHMVYAWISLFWVGFTDLYIRMVSMGFITDFNTWN